MADMRTSIVMELVDRVTAPVRRIRSAVSGLSNRMGFDRLAAQAGRVKAATGDAITNLGNLTRRLAYMGGAAAGAAWGTERLISSVADAGAELRNWSGRLEADVQWLQQWIYTGRQFGVQQQAMMDGFKELSMRADEFVMTGKGPAAEAFRRLGIGGEELQNTQGNTEQIFDLVLSKIRDVENAAARQRIVDELFGGQAAEQMAEMMGRPADEIRRIMREGRESGAFFTEEDLEQSRKYDQRMKEFRQTLRGIHVTVVGEILPGVTDWLSRMRDLTRANREAVSGRIVSRLREFWDILRRIGAAVSWAADRVGGFGNLALWLAGILAGRFVLSVVLAILELRKLAVMIAKLVVVGIAALSRGLIALAVRAVPAAIAGIRALSVALLTTPVGWIITGISLIAGAAYLIYRHWGGISAWFSRLWENIEQTIGDGVQWIKERSSALIGIGKAWVGGLWSGIQERWGQLTGWLSEKAGSLTGRLSDWFSPGALADVGKNWIGGLWSGIQERWGQLTGWLSERIQALTDWMPDWAKGRLGMDNLKAPAPANGSLESSMGPAASRSRETAGYNRTDVGGELRIVIDSEGRPRLRESHKRGPMDFSVESGLMGVAP